MIERFLKIRSEIYQIIEDDAALIVHFPNEHDILILKDALVVLERMNLLTIVNIQYISK